MELNKNKYKQKQNKLALILHVGNIKVFQKIIEDYPNFFNNERIDLYISCNKNDDYDLLKTKFPNSNIFIFGNIGMDIGPFLLIIQYMINKNLTYDYYIKIHTKTDPRWRNVMIKPIYNNLEFFLNYITIEPSIQLYGCKEFYYNGNFNINYNYILDIIKRNYPDYTDKFLNFCKKPNQLQCVKTPYFIAGTVFVFNQEYFNLFKKITNINYEYNILESGYITNDERNPRKTHAWEYLFGYIVFLNNNNIILI